MSGGNSRQFLSRYVLCGKFKSNALRPIEAIFRRGSSSRRGSTTLADCRYRDDINFCILEIKPGYWFLELNYLFLALPLFSTQRLSPQNKFELKSFVAAILLRKAMKKRE